MQFRRLKRVFLFTAYSQLAQMGGQVLQVPFFLHNWGEHLYGYWLVLFAIPSAISLADFGIGSVAANEMSLAGEGSGAQRRQLAAAAWTLQIFISAAVLIAILGATSLFPIIRWLSLPASDARAFKATIVILCVYSLLVLQANSLSGIYRAREQYERYLFAVGTSRLLEVGAAVIALCAGAGTVAVALSYTGVRAIAMLCLYAAIPAGDRPRFSPRDVQALRHLVPLGFAFMALPAGNAAQNYLPVLVLNGILGPVSVVLFSTCRQLVRLVTNMLALINNSVWTEYSLLIGNGKKLDAFRLHRLALSGAWLSCGLIAVGLAIFGPRILLMWTSHKVAVTNVELLCFIVPLLFNTTWSTSAIVLAATNNHRGYALRFMLGSMAAGAICIPFVRLFGVIGAPFSLLLVDLLLIPYVLPRSCGILGDSVVPLVLDAARLTELRRNLLNYYRTRPNY